MSSLKFTKAPPLPEGVPQEVWDAEWIGLWVGPVSVFPCTIGYLGDMPARVYIPSAGMWREGTPDDGMNTITDKLVDLMWIPRGALIHTCKYFSPLRPTILTWLEEEGQRGREYFAVPDSVAEYLP